MTGEMLTRWVKAAALMVGPVLWLALPWVLTACQASPAPAVVTATPSRPDAQIAVTQTPTQTVLEVVSQGGIGEADVEMGPGARPPRLVIRLHLAGLEQFRLTYGDTIITAAVASVGQPIVRQQRSLLSAPATEETLTDASCFWLPLRLVTDTATAAQIPLENGAFELELSPDFWAGDYRSFHFEWIDFFRG
ncbi:MAG: hypothetical protein WA029_21190 [Anaerolineae bacterium]